MAEGKIFQRGGRPPEATQIRTGHGYQALILVESRRKKNGLGKSDEENMNESVSRRRREDKLKLR